MQLSLVLATLLCLTTWLNFVKATTGPVQNCPCVSWSKTRVHPDRIVRYTNQMEGVCSISAVKFLTIRGITLCSDPNSNWAKQVIKKLNAKTRVASTASTNTPPQNKLDWILTTKGEKTQDDEGSASDMTPAASTESQNTTPQNKTTEQRLQYGLTLFIIQVGEASESWVKRCALLQHVITVPRVTARDVKRGAPPKMQLNLVLATLLCLTTWLNLVQATTGPVQNCSCVSWSKKRVRPNRIVSYTNQKEGACSISAVKFLTIRGITLCSDPNSKWAKQVIKKVDAKTKASSKKTRNEGSASVMTPAASTASTNTPPQKKMDWIVTTKVEKTQDNEGSASVMTPAASTASQNTTPQHKTTQQRSQ
ncbi:uncharacterized protein LOC121644407 [Melanotaenia boesemani]|uniref:uncharacterized protein LOC121644407 n=1 Tax=Melanotaenia boesemani TaxID=1250792 RepID=UPI001C043558|nr:uncharacterized protein LOC121644407 [Melanotaenia boesemani]